MFTKPTNEQLERLALIPDPEQRQVILEAIQRGEDIPEYVWRPINRKLQEDPQFKSLHAELLEYAWRSGRDMSEVIASMDPVTLVQHFAQRARHSATKESGYLCSDPFVVPPFLEEAPSCRGLVVWGIFNPYGPTLWGLVLIDVPGKGESLLYSVMLNPFNRKDEVYGLLPKGLTVDEITVIVRQLFHSHATGPHALMPDCLPSFVLPLKGREDLFCQGLSQITSAQVKATCARIQRKPNDPWGVASEDPEKSYAAAMALMRDRKAGELKHHNPKTADQPASHGELQAWLDLVRTKEHLWAYLDQLPHAWNGAIEHGPTAMVGWPTVDGLLKKMSAYETR